MIGQDRIHTVAREDPATASTRRVSWLAVSLLSLGIGVYAMKTGLLWAQLTAAGGQLPLLTVALGTGVVCVALGVVGITLIMRGHPRGVVVMAVATALAVTMTVLAQFLPAPMQQTGALALLALGYGCSRSAGE